jgi:hypothetical protein
MYSTGMKYMFLSLGLIISRPKKTKKTVIMGTFAYGVVVGSNRQFM